MIFSSYEFIFGFLPAVWIIYVLLSYFKLHKASKIWLVVASLFFYGFWNIGYLPLILISIVLNYMLGTYLSKSAQVGKRKLILAIGISGNLVALGYYKYFDFFIENVNSMFGLDFQLLHIVLPLAISFFTFVQIAYLVDAYRHEALEYNFFNYVLFVTYFPHLIAGPIVHHKQLMPQFARNDRFITYENMAKGLFIFMMGLFKKTVIADSLAVWVAAGFQSPDSLSFVESWGTSLAYTFQLYFDFSGYSDMAIGASLLFNIIMPINFNSPYKATSIQDFWKRWHMTLTRFLTQYVYIPLGGNRKGITRTYINIFLIFFLSGLWHGAGWMFVVWGTLHGIASVINRIWTKAGFRMPKWLGWLITFNFVNMAFVFFRANTITDAISILKGMAGQHGVVLPSSIETWLPDLSIASLSFVEEMPIAIGTDQPFFMLGILLLLAFIVSLFFKNSIELTDKMKPTWTYAIWAAGLFAISLLYLSKISEFLYFNF